MDNDLELCLVQGISYNVPNPKEIDTYVRFEFPWPNVSIASLVKLHSLIYFWFIYRFKVVIGRFFYKYVILIVYSLGLNF